MPNTNNTLRTSFKSPNLIMITKNHLIIYRTLKTNSNKPTRKTSFATTSAFNNNNENPIDNHNHIKSQNKQLPIRRRPGKASDHEPRPPSHLGHSQPQQHKHQHTKHPTNRQIDNILNAHYKHAQ